MNESIGQKFNETSYSGSDITVYAVINPSAVMQAMSELAVLKLELNNKIDNYSSAIAAQYVYEAEYDANVQNRDGVDSALYRENIGWLYVNNTPDLLETQEIQSDKKSPSLAYDINTAFDAWKRTGDPKFKLIYDNLVNDKLSNNGAINDF